VVYLQGGRALARLYYRSYAALAVFVGGGLGAQLAVLSCRMRDGGEAGCSSSRRLQTGAHLG
jgi:hypothetical protein